MKTIKTFEQFKNESVFAQEAGSSYDKLAELMEHAAEITGENTETPDEALEALEQFAEEPDMDEMIRAEAFDVMMQIEDILSELEQKDAKLVGESGQVGGATGFGNAHSNVPEGIPIRVEPQDSLLRRAKKLLGWDVKDLEVAVEQLYDLGTKEAKTLASSLLKSIKYNEDVENSPSPDEYEDYLNGTVGVEDLMEDDKYEYLRKKADADGQPELYQDNTYGTLLRTYDMETFNDGYDIYCKIN